MSHLNHVASQVHMHAFQYAAFFALPSKLRPRERLSVCVAALANTAREARVHQPAFRGGGDEYVAALCQLRIELRRTSQSARRSPTLSQIAYVDTLALHVWHTLLAKRPHPLPRRASNLQPRRSTATDKAELADAAGASASPVASAVVPADTAAGSLPQRLLLFRRGAAAAAALAPDDASPQSAMHRRG